MGIRRETTALSCALILTWAGVARAEEPLSAIGWLSNVVETPTLVSPPKLPQERDVDDVALSATPAAVTTTTLGAPSRDAVGLRPIGVTGLPANFWGTTSSRTLAMALADLRADLPPPLAALLRMLLLAELAPPLDSGPEALLFQARVDTLLNLGAMEQAKALLDRAGPGTPALFRRWFDVSLLTGEEDVACTAMLREPDMAPTYPARIFCLARSGDWDAAALTLNTAESLGVISADEDALLARFLDPELFEGAPPLPAPQRVTPLNFRMHEAIGEPLSQLTLPNAFAFAELSENVGWKPRITAAERLTRSGAIPPSRLLAIYSERQPAASGGVWDRAGAVQDLEAALMVGDAAQIAAQLPKAQRAMRRAGLEPALAEMFGEALLGVDLPTDPSGDQSGGRPGGVRAAAARLAFLSPAYESAARAAAAAQTAPALWRGVATGDPALIKAGMQADPTALQDAIAQAFMADAPAQADAPLVAEGKLGLATLNAIKRMENGAGADPKAIEDGLRTLRHLGFADTARRTALLFLINP